MSMDSDDREPVSSNNDSPLFGATPVWERGRKRRGLAARRPVEARSFAAEEETPMTLDQPVAGPSATVTNSTLAADTLPAEDDTLVAPIGGRTTTRSRASGGAAPAALIVGGIVAVAALAGAGWYAMRGHPGVPEITPGSASNQVATAPLPPPLPATGASSSSTPTQLAVNGPTAVERPLSQAAPAHARVAPARRATHTARAASAETSGANASAHAALPDAPQPYTSLNPQATPAPVTPAAPPPPTQQTAPPAPESIPSSPPVSTPASPQPAQPTPPDTQVTPPTTN